MKNKFKKLTLGLLSVAMIAGTTMTLSACGKGKDQDKLQVMNLSVNPGVEFIVDEKDKVVSVTADNEDGAYILNNFTEFTGMSATDAAAKFLDLSEQYGFVVSGSTNGETFTISVSGDGAKELYNDVKDKISDKANELGLQIANMIKIGEDELEEIIAECYQEYSEAEIDDLSEEKMLELLKQSREETKGLYTEDERLAYYKDRAQKVVEAKIDAIKTYVDENSGTLSSAILNPMISALDEVYNQIQSSYTTINNELDTLNANINTQLDNYILHKQAYLDAVEAYRNAVEENADADEIASLKADMESKMAEAKTFQTSLATARDEAKNQIMNMIKTTVHTQLTNLNVQINSILENINLTAKDIQNAINAEINTLKTEYTNNAENPWAD